jgi:hypothetical protein
MTLDEKITELHGIHDDLAAVRARRRGLTTAARELRKQLRGTPSRDPKDPGYRRLRYCRYADDTLLGFAGPKAEAEEIKQRLAQFLRYDLKWELNPDKTLITQARTRAASFLGYEITVQRRGQVCSLPEARKTRASNRAVES